MRILVTGVSGNLGAEVFRLSKEETYGTYFSHIPESTENTFAIDLSKQAEVYKIVGDLKPDWVIHCAALARVEQCEENHGTAIASNVTATENIAEACRKIGSRMVYVSTDYVFQGRHGGMYQEDDETKPVNFYGKTKLMGEQVTATLPSSVIVRTSMVYSARRGNYVDNILKDLAVKGTTKGITDITSSPTLASELAEALLKIVKRHFDHTEVFHMSGATRMNRYDFACKIAEAFGYDTEAVIPSTAREFGWKASRPGDTSLNISKALAAGFKFSKIDDALKELKRGMP